MDDEEVWTVRRAHADLVALAEALRLMGAVAAGGGLDENSVGPDGAASLLGTFLRYSGYEAQRVADLLEGAAWGISSGG